VLAEAETAEAARAKAEAEAKAEEQKAWRRNMPKQAVGPRRRSRTRRLRRIPISDRSAHWPHSHRRVS
jgi:hypothetical protein